MRQVLDVNILEDPAVQKAVARWTMPCTIAALVLVVAGIVYQLMTQTLMDALGWLGWLVVLYVVSLPLHELVHAAFFKMFGPAGTRIIFGYKSGMLYAGCPGVRLPRGRFITVLMAPFVVLTLGYLALGLGFHAWLLAWCLFFAHTAGCAGDFYFVRLILRHPEADLCEDTSTGIALWDSRR